MRKLSITRITDWCGICPNIKCECFNCLTRQSHLCGMECMLQGLNKKQLSKPHCYKKAIQKNNHA